MDPRLNELRSRRAAGEHLAAMRLAEQMLKQPEGMTDEDAFEAARSGATAAMFAGRVYEAYQLAKQARWWAEVAENDEGQATAAYYEGTILLHLGRTAEAVDRLQAYVQQSHLAKRHLGAALFNLGVAAILRRHYATAGKYLVQSRAWFRRVGDASGEIKALLELAWTELLRNRMEPAGRHLKQARRLLERYSDAHLQAVRCVYMAYYYYLTHELEPAMQLCEEVLNPGRPGVTALERSEAAWICGECALAQGRLDEARDMASLAMDEAIQAKWAVINRADDLRRRVIQTAKAAAE